MENSFTPEYVIDKSVQTMMKSVEGAAIITAPMFPLLFKFITMGLDSLVSHFEALDRFEPLTKAMRNTAWKDEYKKRESFS